jgi:hypothetical protein
MDARWSMSTVVAPAQAALAYLALGWSVVPVHTPTERGCSCGRPDCGSPGKHPRLAWQRLTHHRPGVGEVLGWWRRWPDANVGIVTGQVSGIAVVDVDAPTDGEDVLAARERAAEPLPPTVESRTGGGGRHIWLTLPPAGAASAVLDPGLELKAEGATVVAPPSRHRSGRRYEWVPGRAPWELALAPAPQWLVPDGAPADELGRIRDAPLRTEAEREEFAAAWREVGIELRPGDRYYHCPFHDDRHPSLHVDAEGCRWYCFGCGRGGGIGRLQRLLDGAGAAHVRSLAVGAPLADEAAIPGEEEVPVVGEGRHQDELLGLTGGRRHYAGARAHVAAELVPEPGNRYDPDAIAVEIEGLQVGYMRHSDAVAYRAAVDAARRRAGRATCEAIIRGGWDRGRGDVGAFGVVLLLPARG